MIKDNSKNYAEEKMVVSFSNFPFLFGCVVYNHFTNYLYDEKDFFSKFSLIFRKIVPELENYNVVELSKKDIVIG